MLEAEETGQFLRNARGEWAVAVPAPDALPGLDPQLVIREEGCWLEVGMGDVTRIQLDAPDDLAFRLAADGATTVTVIETEGGVPVRSYTASVEARQQRRRPYGAGFR